MTTDDGNLEFWQEYIWLTCLFQCCRRFCGPCHAIPDIHEACHTAYALKARFCSFFDCNVLSVGGMKTDCMETFFETAILYTVLRLSTYLSKPETMSFIFKMIIASCTYLGNTIKNQYGLFRGPLHMHRCKQLSQSANSSPTWHPEIKTHHFLHLLSSELWHHASSTIMAILIDKTPLSG